MTTHQIPVPFFGETVTARTKINVHDGIISMKFDGEVINFNIYDDMRYPDVVSAVDFMYVIKPLTA